MRNFVLFALISATLFACAPIENEPIVEPAPVLGGGDDSVITPDTVWQGYDFGFYYGKTYEVRTYTDFPPQLDSIVFVNDTVAFTSEATFRTDWNEDGVLLSIVAGAEPTFFFNYNAEADALVWAEEVCCITTITKF